MRKKILIIENSIHVTGALNTVLRTSLALKHKYDFIFVLPQASKASIVVRENNFEVIEIPMLELSKRWQSMLFYLPSLIRSAWLVKKIAKDQGVAVVHVNDFYNLIMPLWRLCGGCVKYLCYVNFVPDRFPFLLRKIWINSHRLFSSKIITVSNHVLKQLPVDHKIVCVPCALPEEPESTGEDSERKKAFLFLGNLMEGKGQDMAIRSFALIAAGHRDWKLRIVGGDMGLEKNRMYKASLRKLSSELGIEAQLEWSDFSTNVIREYLQSSVALNFSRSESFSLTVQEAMFYGCPIIATRSGGPSELIEDNFSGLLVPVDDVLAMSKAMEYLIENPRERVRFQNNALTSIRANFGRPNTIDRLDRVYESMIQA